MESEENADLSAGVSSVEEPLSEAQVNAVRAWAIWTAVGLAPGRALALLFFVAVTEETRNVWNRVTKADLASGTGLSRSGVKEVLRALQEERNLRARETIGPGASSGVNEYALPEEAFVPQKKGGGRTRPAAARKPRKNTGATNNIRFIVSQEQGVGQGTDLGQS